MVAKLKTIVIVPDSEVGRLLKDADDGPLLLESSGTRYRLERIERPFIVTPSTPDEIWVDYDPVALSKALEESAGSWADVDVDELLEELYGSREQASRSHEGL